MRSARFALFVATALVVSACQDTGPAAPALSSASASVTSASCTADVNDLIAQSKVLFGSRAPNYNSVRGKLMNLVSFLGHRNVNQREKAKDRAHEIVEFTLALHADGRLNGTDAQVTAFVNGVYCLAGIDVDIPDAEDTWFILPTDLPQTLIGLDGTAAVSLAGFPVFEPSILRIERFEGQLNTKLDQYPGFVRITLINEGNTGLTGRATVSVCAEEIPTSVDFADLRLGHGINETGFVITPLPESDDPTPTTLACDTEEDVARGFGARAVRAFGALFAPKELHARQGTVRRGGVTGTVTEFSPFAPVDTKLRSGGVTGTVTEFLRSPVTTSFELAASATLPSCAVQTVGGLLPPECQPVLTITTRLGTVLEGVPVDWMIPEKSSGSIAPRSGDLFNITCGTFARTASTVTTALGNTGVCWKVGGYGLSTVIATPRFGGDAPEGVTFDNDGEPDVVFEVEVSPPGVPTTITVIEGDGQSSPAGSPAATAPRVRVLDNYGAPVSGATVYWDVRSGGGSTAAATSTTDADGYASTAWTLGEGYNQLKAYINQVVFAYVYFEATGTTP